MSVKHTTGSALALAATMSLASSAQALTISDLSRYERDNKSTVAYVIDLIGLGFVDITSVELEDDHDRSTVKNPGYDVDGIGLFGSDPGVAPSAFPLTSGAADTPFDSFSATNIGNAGASFAEFDGVNDPDNYFSIGDNTITPPADSGNGTFTAFFTNPVTLDNTNRYLITQDVGDEDLLGSIKIDGLLSGQQTPPPVPLPAAGWLLLAGIGGLGALRKFRKA